MQSCVTETLFSGKQSVRSDKAYAHAVARAAHPKEIAGGMSHSGTSWDNPS